MGMKPRRRTWRWVTRDEGMSIVEIYSGIKKPKIEEDDFGSIVYISSSGDFIEVCVDEIKRLTGIWIKEKSCQRMEILITHLDDNE